MSLLHIHFLACITLDLISLAFCSYAVGNLPGIW